MSLSHHGDAEQSEWMRRFSDQLNGTARRAYPAGRMGADDDGQLSFAISSDVPRQTVIIRFGKPVEWIGLGIDDIDRLIDQLSERKLELRGVKA